MCDWVAVGVCGWGGSKTCMAGVAVGRVWMGGRQ